MDEPTETDRGPDDPRMNDAYLRRCPGGTERGDVALVGVVHDHPSSLYRVERVVESTDPETVALELPPLAVPLFEAYADGGPEAAEYGGEMSAAIRSDGGERTAGIDGPTLGFVGRLARTLYRERAAPSTVLSSLRALGSVTRHAAICRVAAAIAERTSRVPRVDSPNTYDVGQGDEPVSQADDERRQVRKAQFVLQAFGSSQAGNLRDTAREAYMADRLSDLRSDGDVVAVVGIDHLDPLVDRLETAE